MGKLLFSRDAVDAWIAEGARRRPNRDERQDGPEKRPAAAVRRPNVFLGSHDPLLDWALRESRSGFATYFDGSLDGLERFAAGEGVAAGLHLHDPAAQDWNTPQVAARLGAVPAVLIEWARRRRGLVTKKDLPKPPETIAALKGRRVATRQIEAGAQQLFSHILREAGLRLDDLGATLEVRSELDAALAVAEGRAEAAFGLEAIAAPLGLRFTPILEERFDLLVDRRAWFEPPMQTFLDFVRSDAFQRRAAEVPGYDVADLGRVRFNGA